MRLHDGDGLVGAIWPSGGRFVSLAGGEQRAFEHATATAYERARDGADPGRAVGILDVRGARVRAGASRACGAERRRACERTDGTVRPVKLSCRTHIRSMSAGLAALLDDVAVLARAAAASVDDVAAGAGRASVKAAGVIVDDAAVTPRYVQGFQPERELPVIKRIAIGSLRNKLLFILPAALVLSEFVEWLLTPILMVGGAYLCFEGAEKLWEAINPHHHEEEAPASESGAEQEETLVKGAIRTDFILSAEIMVISLNEVADEPLLSRALILVAVAFLITALVYGVVGLIVKMDDVGLKLARDARRGGRDLRARAGARHAGRALGALDRRDRRDALGRRAHPPRRPRRARLHVPYDKVHHVEEDVDEALGAVGGVGAWLTNTAASAILGLVVGAIVVAIMHLRGGHKKH